jgi:hypothetical protein
VNAGLDVVRADQVLEQKIGDWFLFSILQYDCPCDKFPVDEDATSTSSRMNTDKRVDGCDRVFVHEASRETSLVDYIRRRVLDFDPVQKFLEGRREAPGGFDYEG